ncbi:MAG: DNA-directed RNA polymerase subunit alpha C-terminal domain-containing protein [Planctomycetota bacterium]
MSVETINERAASEYFTRGREAEDAGDLDRAIEHYDHALGEDPDHDEACFRLARLYDQHGNDTQAIELYERICGGSPVPLSALVNLAILYEDNNMYEEARRCLEAVLQTDPNHKRARRFLGDVDAAHDRSAEEEERARQQRDAVLDMPVFDFELSVRARNALKKMNIETIGDLLRIREQDLMGFKNFGETSLAEIKALLASKGLRLGQLLEEGGAASMEPTGSAAGYFVEGAAPSGTTDGLDGEMPGELLERPISDLDFSVRSRKALQRLNIQTVGELAAKSEDELLACKNFGQTSLNEIRQILASFGIGLRKEG